MEINNHNYREYVLFLYNVYKYYGSKIILEDIDLAVREGEFCTVVGASGCGKSTLLRLILGQERISSGTLLIEGEEIFEPSPERGIVYQKYSLFPHLTVLENVLIGLQLRYNVWQAALKKSLLKEEAMEYLKFVKLSEHADKYPHELSGGMQQRIAIAQTLIKKPRILLMDEPFGALDPGTREDMHILILKLWEEHKMTIFFVTHDLPEAVFLGTRIIVLSKFYKDARGEGPDVQRGARITIDYPLKKGALSTSFKQTAEYTQVVERIRRKGFETEFLKDVDKFDLEHDLKHPDSFITIPDELKFD